MARKQGQPLHFQHPAQEEITAQTLKFRTAAADGTGVYALQAADLALLGETKARTEAWALRSLGQSTLHPF